MGRAADPRREVPPSTRHGFSPHRACSRSGMHPNRTWLVARAAELRRQNYDAEGLMWSELRAKRLGYKFRYQHVIGLFIVDFACPEKRVVVEVDGEHTTRRRTGSVIACSRPQAGSRTEPQTTRSTSTSTPSSMACWNSSPLARAASARRSKADVAAPTPRPWGRGRGPQARGGGGPAWPSDAQRERGRCRRGRT